VPPSTSAQPYEIRVFESGRIETRPDNLHDWFNALCWLAFPRTKAKMNALHAAEIPREGGRRGRLRDLLTILDEGGAVVLCSDQELNGLVRAFSWKELFWEPRPGITCKVVFGPSGADADGIAAQWLARAPASASPRDLAPLPVFGFPGWSERQDARFYEDPRYFRVKS